MRLLKLVVVVVAGTVVCGCGGSSSDGLFDGKNPASVGGASSAAGGATSFPGTGGEVAATGGASALGSGGSGAEGGFTGSAGNTGSGGLGGGFGTGGEGVGGFLETGGGGTSTGGTTVIGDGGATGSGGAVSGVCPAGDYSGKLKGLYTSSAGTKDIGASITFVVDSAGGVTGSFSGPGNAKAKLTGKVDCSTGVLSIEVQNGTYPVGLLTVSFSGVIGGHYSDASKTFENGTWNLTERNNPGNGGTGTWAP